MPTHRALLASAALAPVLATTGAATAQVVTPLAAQDAVAWSLHGPWTLTFLEVHLHPDR